MVFVTRKRKAALNFWASKRLTNKSTAAPLPMMTESEPISQHSLELSIEDALESTMEIDIKQEPLEVGQDEQLLLQYDEMKVEVELLAPQDTCPPEEELDPIGQYPNQKLFQETERNQQDHIRCQFCLKRFREGSGHGGITQSKIAFVLGLRELSIPGSRPACCEGCREMFELFYDFKRSCLVALARPAELLVQVGANENSAKLVDSMVNIGDKESKRERPASCNKTKNDQQTEEFAKQREDSKRKSVEVQTPSNEAHPTNMKQDIGKPSLECQICMEKFSYRLVLKKHWLNHFCTSPKKTVTKPTVAENITDLPIFGAKPDISAPEPDPSTVPKITTDLPPISNADLDISVPERDPQTAESEEEEQKKTYCDRCRKWYSTKTIYTHHKPFCIKFRVSKNPKPSFECSLCPEKFRREQDLTLHINKHNGVRTIPCRRDGCTRMFFTARVRYMHEKCCGQGAQLICNVCGSLFRTDSSLRYHLYTHEDPKFSCEICNKSFHTRANLKKHAATHSEERKFQCNVCGKRFKSYEANRVHQRIHTQEKPYACHICGQRFMYNCLLKTHLEKGHEPEEPMQ